MSYWASATSISISTDLYTSVHASARTTKCTQSLAAGHYSLAYTVLASSSVIYHAVVSGSPSPSYSLSPNGNVILCLAGLTLSVMALVYPMLCELRERLASL